MFAKTLRKAISVAAIFTLIASIGAAGQLANLDGVTIKRGPVAVMPTRGDKTGESLNPGVRTGAAAAAGTATSISYNGGPVMAGPVNVYLIWYGAWADPTQASPTSGESIVSDYLSKIAPSNRNQINSAYKFLTTAVGPNVVLQQQVHVSSSTYGTALGANGVTNIVNYALTNSLLPSDSNGLYYVLTSAGITEGVSGSAFLAQYCGYHSYISRTSGGITTNLKYSFVGDPTGPSFSGCSGNPATASPNGNPGVDAMLSVIQHELEETMTDPELNAFYDPTTGQENADICAWTFGTTTSVSGYQYNMTLGNRKFLIQQNWVPGTTTALAAPARFTGGFCSMSQTGASAITSFTPTGGVTGTVVTITGTNFTGATDVKFNGVSASSFTVNSATQIVATVPAGASAGTIQVVTPLGASTSASSFAIAANAIASFSPGFGNVGATVVITGNGFTGATGVSFNGTAASSFTVDSNTQITAVVPSLATTGAITVAAVSGTLTSASNFVVTTGPAPVISSLSVSSGKVGDTVTITGTGLTGATRVSVNGTTASVFNVASDTSITFTVPAGATTGTVRVDTPDGWAFSSTFTVIVPTITSFTPATGLVGTTVTLTGTNFTGATDVKFNGVSASSFNVVNDTTITAVAPATGTSGAISVITPAGTVASATNFTYSAPTIASFTPTSAARGTTVTITGTNFTGATSVKFNGVAAASFVVNSATSISAVVGNTATTGKVSVTTPGGTATSIGNFTVSLPTLTSFTSAIAVGSTVTLTGTNLTGTTAVTFNTTPAASFTVVSATQISAVVPVGVTAGKVSITTPSGTITSTGSYTLALPTVTTVAPSAVAVGSVVTLTGTNFTGATAVKFGTVAATSFTVVSATSITVTVPAGVVASTVTVTTPTGTTATGRAYTLALPTVTTVAPSAVTVGSVVTLTGTNFTGATAVKFGTVAATSFTVVSATSITVTVPAGIAAGNVTVTTPTGTTAAGRAYTLALPTVTAISQTAVASGTLVTLTGTNFTGATGVKFGTVSATSFTVVSATSITVTVPAGISASTVTVTTPTGTTATGRAYKVAAVSISSVTVGAVPVTSFSAGNTVVLTGTGLTGATTVRFNGVAAVSSTATATTITLVAPTPLTSGSITFVVGGVTYTLPPYTAI